VDIDSDGAFTLIAPQEDHCTKVQAAHCVALTRVADQRKAINVEQVRICHELVWCTLMQQAHHPRQEWHYFTLRRAKHRLPDGT
jgi:hypothetical protein